MLDRLDIALILSSLIAGLMGATLFSLIIKLSFKKKFIKENNARTVHGKYVSTLGGIGIFLGLMIGLAVEAMTTEEKLKSPIPFIITKIYDSFGVTIINNEKKVFFAFLIFLLLVYIIYYFI